MANYKQLSYGSTGDEVVQLQKKLNEIGNYGLDTDGIYGDKTQAAVKDYQQKNSLKVDGVAGDETFGSLYKTQAGTSAPAAPSNNVLQAEALLQQQLQKPGAYTSSWQAQLDDILQKIQNREKFSYDMNADALYQQLKDQHVQLGQMASMDAMGQAAALTGGYGSSYGQAVGQQAYQRNLQALMDKAPELYQLALNQHNAEGDELYRQASLIAGMEEQDYGRYRDQVSDAQWDKSFQYQQDRDKKADEKWQAEFDEAKRQYDQSYALSASKSSGGNYTYPGGNDTGDDGYDNGGVSEGKIKDMQRTLGLTADGKWGPESRAAAGGLSAAEAYELWNQGKLPGAQKVSDGDINTFQRKLHPESQHDRVMRATYGPYTAYVAYMLEKDTLLSDVEKDYLISYYGITSSDRQYLIDKGLI